MKIANNKRGNDLIRCIRSETINGSVVQKVVMLHPNIVSNAWLLQSTGCIVDDPKLDEKLAGRIKVEGKQEPPIITTEPQADEVISKSHINEAVNSLIENIESDPGKPKEKRGRKKGSKNKPVNI